MTKPFVGLVGYAARPLFLVSLSGGGFRAALYHAGVLRALHEAGMLEATRRKRIVFINAVSGGAIPALIWDAFGRAPVGDRLWPEKLLLDLVTSVPRGRLNWKVRGSNSWRKFLISWWDRHTGGIELSDNFGVTTFVELLDYLTGSIHVACGADLLKPDNELYKTGLNFWRFEIAGLTRRSAMPLFMAAATAFPIYFKRWTSVPDKSGKRHELLDAGLIDNLGAQAFMPFFGGEAPAWEIQEGSSWFLSNAGARMAIPSTAATPEWETGVGRLSLLDRIFRYTGDLAQPAYERMIMSLVRDHTNFDVYGVRIGTLAEEEPWMRTRSLPDENAVARLPTALSRMKRENAVCVMLQGAQTASFALKLPPEARNNLREELLALAQSPARRDPD
jgi:hypothetical protein